MSNFDTIPWVPSEENEPGSGTRKHILRELSKWNGHTWGDNRKMQTKHRKKSWVERTTISDQTWISYDLTETDFANVIFQDTVFSKCIFSKSKFSHIRLFGCSFFECQFDHVNLKDAPFGGASGLYRQCRFTKCDFRGQDFTSPRFEECQFDNCKLKKISFNDATFSQCQFIGKLEDVTFNGIYRRQPSRFPTLENVDFSEASFGEFVTFDNDCDLTTCIPPKGTTFASLLYAIYRDDPTTLSTGSEDRILLTRKRRK
jgi:fluoroquinolone resistance protein